MVAATLLTLLATFTASTARAAEPSPFFNGFETDLTGWFGSIVAAPSGTAGIPSASGGFHGRPAASDFTRFGPVSVASEFPADGYAVSVDVYLNVSGGWANDTRFDWSSAFNKNSGTTFGRDFVFNGGFYNDTDATGSGNRFVFTASNGATRSSSFPKNPARSPFTITTTGWYTLHHRFYNNGSGILAVDLTIRDASGNVLKKWTLSDPSDLAGPNDVDPRYGFIAMNESAPNVSATTAGGGVLAALDNTRLRLLQPPVSLSADSPVEVGSTQTLVASGGAGDGEYVFSVGASTSCSVAGDQLTVTAPGSCIVTVVREGNDTYDPSEPSAPVTIGTINDLIVNPITPVYDANNVTGVQADAAPGFPTGSLASNGIGKTDIYLTPSMLFGAPVTLGDIKSIRYWTKKGSTHSASPADWYLAIYTNPFPGDVSSASWYGDRIGSEPYFSAAISDPANTWNQWTSDGASNKLRFFQSTAGAPGATLGSYTDPHWDTFVTGNSVGTSSPLAGHGILFLSVQTASNWAAGFTGQLDGLRVELTNGSIANVNFEFQCVQDSECETGSCATDSCNVSTGNCSSVLLPSTVECRAAAGDCDLAENCTGEDAACPADLVEPSSTECRASGGVCDLAENCDGTSADCPVDAFASSATECRASDGVCDVAENCSGNSAECPADAFVPSSTECRASGGVCDVAENCTGESAACPADGFAPSATECRASDGVCDVAESCTGNSADCPTDVFAPLSTECRAPGGACDIAENCTGESVECPADSLVPSGTECRASGGDCDVAESCTGNSVECPDDAFVPSSTECRASGGVCDVAENCTGESAACPADAFVSSATVCRASSGSCDAAEACTGFTAPCPADAFEPVLTPCPDDEELCTDDHCDGAGECIHPPIPLASVCNWSVVAGDDARTGSVRIRNESHVNGGVCADTTRVADLAAMTSSATANSMVLLADSGTAAKVYPDATITGGSVLTAGGCVAPGRGALIFGATEETVCCANSPVTLPGGSPSDVIDACGLDPMIEECTVAKSGVPVDVADLDLLPSTQSLGTISLGPQESRTILVGAGLNVVDIDKLKMNQSAILTIDAQGNADSVVVLRLAGGLVTKVKVQIVPAGGLTASNLLIYSVGGNCNIGLNNVGSGTLYCPEGKVRLRQETQWDGALAGLSVDIGWYVQLNHVPFLGLAE